MRRARRKLTRREWGMITSRRPVVRELPLPQRPDSPGPNVLGPPTRTPLPAIDDTWLTPGSLQSGQALWTGAERRTPQMKKVRKKAPTRWQLATTPLRRKEGFNAY
jgi:hypothetical protein